MEMWLQVIPIVLGGVAIFFGSKLIKIKKVIKEVQDIFPVLEDVLTDQPGETQQEKIQDLQKLVKESKEAWDSFLELVKSFKK